MPGAGSTDAGGDPPGNTGIALRRDFISFGMWSSRPQWLRAARSWRRNVMASHVRLKLLAAALGIAATSIAVAGTEKALHAQSLGAVPASQLAVKLGLSADNAFVAQNALPTVRGTQTVRMQQTYKGVPVYGHSIAVEQDAQGNALVANGSIVSDLQVELASVTPKLDQAR